MSFLEKIIDKVEAKIDKKYSNPYGYQNQGNGAYQQVPNHHGPPPPNGPPPPYQEDNYTGHGMLGMGRSPGGAHHPPPHHHQRPHSPQPHLPVPHHKPHSPPRSPRRDHHRGPSADFGPGLVNGPSFPHQPEPGFTGGGLLGKLAGTDMPERRGEGQRLGPERGCGMRGRGGPGPFGGRGGMGHRGRYHGGPGGELGKDGGGPEGPGGRGDGRW